jgi:hypothetical protein
MNGWDIQAARWGRWKLHVSRNTSPPWAPVPDAGIKNLPLPRPELYDLHRDPSESYDISSDEPDVVATIRDRMEVLIATLPQNVQDQWHATMTIPVIDTPPGALPIQQT